jgi:hypothetical protein
MTVLLANNVTSTLASAITASATSLVVSSNADKFPTITAGQHYYVTLVSTTGVVEVVKVVSRLGAAMGIVRAQDGTNAVAFAAGSRVELRINAASVLDAVDDGVAEMTVVTNALDARLDTVEAKTAILDSITASAAEINVLDGVTATTSSINAASANYTQIRSSAAALLADTVLTYTAGQTNSVSAGDYIWTRLEGFSYQVASSGATDHHVTTAGGVKLYMAGTKFYFRQLLTGSETNLQRGTKFISFLTAIHDARRTGVIDGGTGLTHALSFSATTHFTLTQNNIHLESDGAAISTDRITGFINAARSPTTTLSADAAWKAASISVASIGSAVVGDLITLTTATSVASTYLNYHKTAVSVIESISGTTITLAHQLPFNFTAAETTVTVYPKRSVRLDNITISVLTPGRFDLSWLQNCQINNLTLTGSGVSTTDPLFVRACVSTTLRNVNVSNCRYGVIHTSGGRDMLIDGIVGDNVIHPVDPSVWSYGTYVKNFLFTNCVGINAHPSFEVHYDTGVSSGHYGIRAIGASARNTTFVNATVAESLSFVGVLAGYEYLAEQQRHYVDNCKAETVVLSFSEGSYGEIRNTRAYGFTNDYLGYGVERLYIHDDCAFAVPLYGVGDRRYIKVQAPVPVQQNSSLQFLNPGATKVVTGITAANPAVVTSVAHGLTTGNSVKLSGVSGMTQINDQFSEITVLTADTFSLNWINSSAYSAYTSGGTATVGTSATYVDICDASNNRRVGSTPYMWYIADFYQGLSTSSVSTAQPSRVRLRLADITSADGTRLDYAYGEIIVSVSGRFDGHVRRRVPFWVRPTVGAVFGTSTILEQIGTEDIVIANLSTISLGLTTCDCIEFTWSLTNWGSPTWINLATVEVKMYRRNTSSRYGA